MIEVIARFKGANGSCGYKTGDVYKIGFQTFSNIFTNDKGISIKPLYGYVGERCDYSSLKKFLENWEVL